MGFQSNNYTICLLVLLKQLNFMKYGLPLVWRQFVFINVTAQCLPIVIIITAISEFTFMYLSLHSSFFVDGPASVSQNRKTVA